MNLHNLLHFLKLRTDSHAQWEIQQYANVIEGIVAELFPMMHASWKNHVKDAVTFSADEWAILKGELLEPLHDEEIIETIDKCGLSKTRTREFKEKLGL
jgi:thymidylate synthase (FAD)